MCGYIPIICEYPYLTKGLKNLLQLGVFTSVLLTGIGLTYVMFVYPREYMFLFILPSLFVWNVLFSLFFFGIQ